MLHHYRDGTVATTLQFMLDAEDEDRHHVLFANKGDTFLRDLSQKVIASWYWEECEQGGFLEDDDIEIGDDMDEDEDV